MVGASERGASRGRSWFVLTLLGFVVIITGTCSLLGNVAIVHLNYGAFNVFSNGFDVGKILRIQAHEIVNFNYPETEVGIKRKGEHFGVFVMGMHHSSTSPLTRLLVEMGFYAGKKQDIIIRRDNPLKYWELRKAVRLNQKMINDQLGDNPRGQDWIGWGYRAKVGGASDYDLNIRKEILSIVSDIEREADMLGKSWVIKDPRLSLTANVWLNALKENQSLMNNMVCIVLVRNPIESSFRFLGYNLPDRSFNITELAAIWQEYTLNSIRACAARHIPSIIVSHEELSLNPVSEMVKLYESLKTINSNFTTTSLRKLNNQDIISVLGKTWTEKSMWKIQQIVSYIQAHDDLAKDAMTPVVQSLWTFLKERSNSLIPVIRLHECFLYFGEWSKLSESSVSLWGYASDLQKRRQIVLVTRLRALSGEVVQQLLVSAASIKRSSAWVDLKLLLPGSLVGLLTTTNSEALQNSGWSITPEVNIPCECATCAIPGVFKNYAKLLMIPSSTVLLEELNLSLFPKNIECMPEMEYSLTAIKNSSVSSLSCKGSCPWQPGTSTAQSGPEFDYWRFLNIVIGKSSDLKLPKIS